MRLCALLATAWLSVSCAAASSVEVVLSNHLDDPRGYCLDIVGSQAKAMPERGLHTHTCYSYQGRLAVDQAFDAEQIKAGVLLLPAFKVCAAVTSVETGSPVRLAACDGTALQRFDFKADGRIVPGSASGLCLTAGSGAGMPGAGGNPVHLMRSLALEPCIESRATYQTWRMRTTSDQ